MEIGTAFLTIMTTEQIIYSTAVSDGMPPTLAILMVAQSKMESGNYKHRFFTIGKNAFGYSYDKNSRWQLDKGGPNADNGVPIAQYKNVEDSTHEVTSWIKRRQRDGQFPKDLTTIKTAMQYTKYLRHGAHPYGGRSDDEYANGIAYWLKDLIIPTAATDITGMLLFAVGIYIISQAK